MPAEVYRLGDCHLNRRLLAALLCGCGSFFSGELAGDGDGREAHGTGGSVSSCFCWAEHLVMLNLLVGNLL